MSPLPILDLIAGMIFIYFLLALVNNSFIELFSGFRQIRAKMLEKWIRNTMGAMSNTIMNHDLLNGLSRTNKSTNYMDAKSFAKVLSEEICKSIEAKSESDLSLPTSINIHKAIQKSNMPDSLKTMLRNFAVKTNAQKILDTKLNEVEHFEIQIEEWFNSVMKLLTGTYKRKTIWFTFLFASVSTLVLNVDSLQLVSYLYNNPEARQKLASASYSAAQDSTYIIKANDIKKRAADLVQGEKSDSLKMLNADINTLVKEIKDKKASMDTTVATMSLFIPIGWPDAQFNLVHGWKSTSLFIIKKIGGLLITILAMCLGAPFWFDVLGKVANLRSSLKPDDTKK